MQCPIDGSQLVMTERSGVEIDYCPQCRGVWLDRGELDKILERSAAVQPAAAPQPAARQAPPPPPPPQGHSDHYGHEKRYDDDYYKKKKRRGFLDDIFDF